jgi:hydrogenase nickel incorporation protein HypA/HybF
MENAMKIVLDKAEQNNILKITKLSFKIGELSGVNAEALKFAFNSISKNSIAEGAELIIDTVEATAECLHCKITFKIDHFNKVCPQCNEFCNNILTGYELYVNTIEGE